MRYFKTLNWSRISSVVVLALLVVGQVAPPVFAIDPIQDRLFKNDIYYFNYKDNDIVNAGCAAAPAGAGLGACTGLVGADAKEQAFRYLTGKGLSPMAAAAVVGNLMAESQVNPTATNPDGGAFGIAQWLGTRLTDLQTYATAHNQDYKLLCTQLDFLYYEITAGNEAPNDVLGKMQAAEAAATGAPADTVTQLATIWENTFERSGGSNLAGRQQNARDIFDLYGGGATTGTGTPAATPAAAATACPAAGANGVAAGSITKTAMGLAWPEPFAAAQPPEAGRTSAIVPKPEYTAAVQTSNGTHAGAAAIDCGVFVGTVMISSGVDPTYPGISTTAQATYVQAHPEKYMVIQAPTQADLMPGDILIKSGDGPAGHTWIFLGAEGGGTYTSASASLGDRAPNLGNEVLGGFILARVI